MHNLLSLFAFGSILVLFGPFAAAAHGHLPRGQDTDDAVVSITLPPSGSVHGTLTIHRAQMAEYYKSEVGIDMDKLGNHREAELLVTDGKDYAFPEGSGVEGVLSWTPTATTTTTTTGRQNAVRVPSQKHVTCQECLGLCAIPFIGPSV